jgi:hypothetical protein
MRGRSFPVASAIAITRSSVIWTKAQLSGCFFSQWYTWAIRSRLEPVKKVARMLKRHLHGVLRFVKHPITNGVAEGLNSGIMSIKRKAGCFRNPSNFTTAIYFDCGGFDLTHADPRRGLSRYQERRRASTHSHPEGINANVYNGEVYPHR